MVARSAGTDDIDKENGLPPYRQDKKREAMLRI
jgi:hypothetical protein